MFKSYLKITVRNLLRNKGFSIVNIGGLAIGMTCTLLISLWICRELSVDRLYPKTDRLFLIHNRTKVNGELWVSNQTPQIMAPTLRQEYPAIEDASRYMQVTFLTSVHETHLHTRGAFADSGFLSMFGFPLLHGDPAGALNSPQGIVITQSFATRLFGDTDPMGKTIRIDSATDFTVTGILKDLPATTSFDFDYLLPWSYIKRLGWEDQAWSDTYIYTYILLKPGITQASFDTRVRDVTTRHSKVTTEVFTQPMSRLYLYSKPENGRLVGDRILTVRLFAIIAGFILIIACINFMNLSTARSERRARAVGIRKVVGASRGILIAQFIGESMLIAWLAFPIALFLTQISLPAFNRLVGHELTLDYSDTRLWAYAIGFVIFTGLVAGSYPAFYLSSFRPIRVLKGTLIQLNSVITPRKILVVLQFSFAIILIICTLIIKRQIQFGLDRDSGYDRDRLVYTRAEGDAPAHYAAIKQELIGSGAALAVTRSPAPITRHWNDGSGYAWPGSTDKDKDIDFLDFGADADFVKTTGVTLLGGRDIDINKYPTDSMAMLLNESAVTAMRLKDPIGQTVRRGSLNFHVVGVVKDFILESPFAKNIAPMLITGPWRDYEVIHFKLNPSNPVSVDLALSEKIFKAYNPRYPFEYNFADEAYAQKFRNEQQIGQLSALFAGLTIFISCLGLFALAAYMAENRIREIGIRKVLGASVAGISALLAKDFVRLVLVAFLIAAPIAWVVMNKWLLSYSYRVPIGWGIFAWSGLLAVSIAIATVSYQSIRAAIANPVRSLRAE
jgi:putative ABC transport system permease protein